MPSKSKLSITTEEARARYKRELPPIHPGEYLREEYLLPLGLSANALAMAIGVPATRIGEIVNEKRGITADTALRLGKFLRTGAKFWMNLQSDYELEHVRFESGEHEIKAIIPVAVDAKTGSLTLKAV